MKLSVAGQDQSASLGNEIAAEAARLAQVPGGIGALDPAHSARQLAAATSEADYLQHYLKLLRMRQGVRTSDFYIPRRAGWVGHFVACIKARLWRLLRYQHYRLTLQQNLINELAAHAVEFQQEAWQQEVADLKRRVAALEQKNGVGSA